MYQILIFAFTTRRFILGIFIFGCVNLGIAAEYGEYPKQINELAYFASDGGWGDPNNQHRFFAIKVGSAFETKSTSYASLQELLDAEDLTGYEGIAIECRECSDYSGGNELLSKLQETLYENGIKNLLFWPNVEWSKARQIFLDRTTGKVVGRVLAAENGEPLWLAHVTSQGFGGSSEKNGAYQVYYLDPGSARLTASRRDREVLETEIEVTAGQTISHDFVLHLAKPACCRLKGEWEIVLTLTHDQRPEDFKPDLVVNTAKGEIVFSAKYKDQLEIHTAEYSDDVLDELGEYDIDLSLFFGDNITASISNTVFAGQGESDLLNQVYGSISHFDQVDISFIPRMSHGGISLRGQIENNTVITGEWHKRDYSVMVSGTFTMTRVSGP